MSPSTQTRPIRVVPLRAPAVRVRAPAAAELTYRGGPLLSAVEVVTVFWGAAPMESLNAFFSFVLASPYLVQLSEYSTPKYAIGAGRLAGTAQVSHPAPGASVTDAAIQQMLEGEVARQSLPAPTANTLYFVFLPPGVTVVAGKDRSCQAFCGYHDRSNGGLYYAAVPYPNCAGCTGGLTVLDALTSVCSHELAEAITDPVPGQGWYDDANGEIGDICAWQNKKLGAYEVQLLWSNRANACV
jgi:hypothetical protein